MNIINKFLTTGIIAFCLTSCADLDLNPLSEGSSENWYHDETEIEMALNDLWRPDFFPIDGIDWDDDLLNRNGSNDVTLGTITSQWGESSTRWNSLYKAIARATKILQALDNGTANGLSNEKINQYKGEAYFMIGFAYCELATYYGDCVLNKGMTLEEAYTAVRTPKSEILAYAYECLDKAAEYLPTSYTGQQRPTKGAALGFKARFALFHEDWETAIQAAEDCMNLEVYRLHDNYQQLFIADSSPEFMFYFKGDLTLKKGYGLFSGIKNYVIRKLGGYANQGPSLELLCSYTCIDGLPTLEQTNAIGIISKAGRYGGTYAHRDIAYHFGMWISPRFQLLLVKEYQRLKEQEQAQIGWSAKRELSKINYRIHTDAIKQNLIPQEITPAQANMIYANEADVLNVAMFGITAKAWREQHPELKGNIRDYASINELICLSNMENLNAVFIDQGMSQHERIFKLNQIAIQQMQILEGDGNRKLLK